MIIGISGKIGSGKDTVGKIICYLTAQQRLYKEWEHIENIDFDHSIQQFISNKTPKSYLYDDVFKIKKFADKLKDIVCLLIGCTREQLEDAEFKNKELGEEWNCWVYESDYNKTTLTTDKETANILTYRETGIKQQRLTPRLLLQLLGTDCGRNIIHPNIWVNSLMSDYKPGNITDKSTLHKISKDRWIEYPNWVITDMRFPNELKAVKDRDGISIRVSRNNNPCVCIDDSKLDCLVKCNKKPQHESETALDNSEFDYVLDNNGTIEELIEKVKVILIKEKIIKNLI